MPMNCPYYAERWTVRRTIAAPAAWRRLHGAAGRPGPELVTNSGVANIATALALAPTSDPVPSPQASTVPTAGGEVQPSLFRDASMGTLGPKVVAIPTLSPSVAPTGNPSERETAKASAYHAHGVQTPDSQQRLDLQEQSDGQAKPAGGRCTAMTQRVALTAASACNGRGGRWIGRDFGQRVVSWNRSMGRRRLCNSWKYLLAACRDDRGGSNFVSGNLVPGKSRYTRDALRGFASGRFRRENTSARPSHYPAIRGSSKRLSRPASGLIWALVDEESLTWHDHISKTFPTTA